MTVRIDMAVPQQLRLMQRVFLLLFSLFDRIYPGVIFSIYVYKQQCLSRQRIVIGNDCLQVDFTITNSDMESWMPMLW